MGKFILGIFWGLVIASLIEYYGTEVSYTVGVLEILYASYVLVLVGLMSVATYMELLQK